MSQYGMCQTCGSHMEMDGCMYCAKLKASHARVPDLPPAPPTEFDISDKDINMLAFAMHSKSYDTPMDRVETIKKWLSTYGIRISESTKE